MPRDPDEDSSSPITPAKPPPSPAGAPRAAPASAALAWGVCGVFHEADELKAYPGQRGAARFVSGGVDYTPPPVQPAWRASTEEPGRYELPWDGDPAAAKTLSRFRKELDQAIRTKQLEQNPHHPLLRDLDRVAAGLAGLAARLHRQRWSLGLIRPDNVILQDTPGGPEPILVDLGFSWRGSFGQPPWEDSPGRPDWLNADQPYRWLWDEEPVRRQMADPDNGVYPPADPQSDLRILGRLLAWLVGGQESEIVFDLSGEPRPYWQVFSDAAAGRVPDAATLGQRLRSHPPSEHFTQPVKPPPPPPPPRASWKPAAAGLIGLALLGGGAALFWPKGEKPAGATPTDADPVVATTPTDDTAPANLPATIAQIETALRESKLAEAVKNLLSAYAQVGTAKAAELSPQREKVLKAWVKEYQSALKLAGDPVRRFEAGNRFVRLRDQLDELTRSQPAPDSDQRAKEEQWLFAVQVYAGQLRAQSPPR